MEIKKYEDGIAFVENGVEVAFYSFITDRVTFYPQNNKRWHDVEGCSSIDVRDLLFITNTIDGRW